MGLFGRDKGNALRRLLLLACLAYCSHAFATQDLKSFVQQAFDFHQKGQFAEALPLLHQAYQLNPRDYLVNLLLGIDTLRMGQPSTAVPYLKGASRLRPKEAFPLDYLGEAYARQDAYGDAAEAYLRVVRVAPGSADSTVAFVDFALSRLAAMSATLRSSKKGLAAEYRLQALGLGATDQARLPLLKRAADLDPTAPGIWSDLALAALAGGDFSLARDSVPCGLPVASTGVAHLRGRYWRGGKILFLRMRPGEVLSASCPRQGLFRKSSYALSRTEMGAVHKTSSATVESERVVAAAWGCIGEPGGVSAGYSCAGTGIRIGSGRLRLVPTLLVLFPRSGSSRRSGATVGGDDAPVHMMRGDILLRLQANAEMAAAEYQLALAKAPHDPAVLARLAEAQFSAGKPDAACENAQAVSWASSNTRESCRLKAESSSNLERSQMNKASGSASPCAITFSCQA